MGRPLPGYRVQMHRRRRHEAKEGEISLLGLIAAPLA
jgi:hypothetical protein